MTIFKQSKCETKNDSWCYLKIPILFKHHHTSSNTWSSFHLGATKNKEKPMRTIFTTFYAEKTFNQWQRNVELYLLLELYLDSWFTWRLKSQTEPNFEAPWNKSTPKEFHPFNLKSLAILSTLLTMPSNSALPQRPKYPKMPTELNHSDCWISKSHYYLQALSTSWQSCTSLNWQYPRDFLHNNSYPEGSTTDWLFLTSLLFWVLENTAPNYDKLIPITCNKYNI